MTFVWLAIGIGLFKNPDGSLLFISEYLNFFMNYRVTF